MEGYLFWIPAFVLVTAVVVSGWPCAAGRPTVSGLCIQPPPAAREVGGAYTCWLSGGIGCRGEDKICGLNHVGSVSPIPVAWLSLFNIVAVLLMLPVMDRIVFPWLERKGLKISLMKRILVGMILSIAAIVAAGILEVFRRRCVRTPDSSCVWVQYIGQNSTYFAADMTILYQIPQYALIGISEVFASVAGLEFAYSQAPRSMQGLIMGLFCLSNGLGVFLGLLILMFASLIGWVKTRDGGNINHSRLDLYFFVLAGIQLIGTLLYCLVMRMYTRRASSSGQNQFMSTGGYRSYSNSPDR